MYKERDNIIIDCTAFEELLTDYLDKTLETAVNARVAEHAMSCPLCHGLLNDVKESLDVCRQISAPASPMTRLEARILKMTTPETALSCSDFEGYLTDYLDGFLPAAVFHRWERHAVLCDKCEDLPGMVVRSIAACYTYKMDELPIPEGLNETILDRTSRAIDIQPLAPSFSEKLRDWVGSLRLPIPQLAPVAMMMILAFMVFSTAAWSSDGGDTNVYSKTLELAQATYQQSADALNGNPSDAAPAKQDPVTGTTYVEEKK